MKNILLFVVSVLSFALSATQGDLVAVTHLTDESGRMVPLFRQRMCPAEANLTKVLGFKRYKVVFKTVDLKGKEVDSAGLMIVPDTKDVMPMYVYQHGTVFSRDELPSSNPQLSEADAMGHCFASLGYLTVLADYLGYGDGTGVHPYLHAESEAWVARDLMRASKTAVAQLGGQLNSQLFIAGYSQGGHAAMALTRFLEQDPNHEFTVTAAAPMAGPYALAETIKEIIKNPSFHTPAEAAYLVMGLNPIYSFYKDLSEIVRPQYIATVQNLFDGTHDWEDAINSLPKTPQDLIQPDYLQKIDKELNLPFMQALQFNEVYQWVPKASVHFYHGQADREVPYSNSETAYNYMKSRGAKVELTSLGVSVDHQAGGVLAFGQAALWFETFR